MSASEQINGRSFPDFGLIEMWGYLMAFDYSSMRSSSQCIASQDHFENALFWEISSFFPKNGEEPVEISVFKFFIFLVMAILDLWSNTFMGISLIVVISEDTISSEDPFCKMTIFSSAPIFPFPSQFSHVRVWLT